MNIHFKTQLPFGRILQATAGEKISKGDSLVLVQETSVAFSNFSVLVAYRKPEGARYYHGTALHDAEALAKIDLNEVTVKTLLPPPDLAQQFVPALVNGENGRQYGVFMLSLRPCSICNRLMMQHSDLFPTGRLDQEQQMKAVGVVYAASETLNHQPICETCLKEGKTAFICEICGEKRTSGQLHTFECECPICTVCYTTLPAAQYDAAIDKIDEAHQWDYE